MDWPEGKQIGYLMYMLVAAPGEAGDRLVRSDGAVGRYQAV